ncbi:MAG: YggT family protein [Rhodobiaceae bacterium]|nr:YggT family protein [Rhodobiaceae bacterium]
MTNPILEYWYFHLPNYLLAVLMYTLLGRFLLSFLFAPGSTNYIWRTFVRMTDPVVRLFAVITPKTVPWLLTILFSFLWLFVIRIALLRAFSELGLAPHLG